MNPSTAVRRACAGMAIALALPCFGQIGGGWVEYFPEKQLQQENSADYSTHTDVDGVETFKLWKNPSGARQRCEIRVIDNYTTGTTQFEGEFCMVKGGNEVSIMQVWLSVIIPVSEADGGSITWWQNRLADHIYGRWIHVNVFHDADARMTMIWFDGVKVGAHETKASNPYYHKYGLYNGASTSPEIMWRKTRFFRNGTMEGAGTALRSSPDPTRDASPFHLVIGGNRALIIAKGEGPGFTRRLFDIKGESIWKH